MVQWNNAAAGDNNGDISSVSFDLSAYGGGTAVAGTATAGVYQASYAVVAGSLDDVQNLNAKVTVTDDAGNATGPIDDTSNLRVDSVKPGLTLTGSTPRSREDRGDEDGEQADQGTQSVHGDPPVLTKSKFQTQQ